MQVVESKTGDDITRQVLTQIIVEDSKAADGGPPLEFLRDLVRSSDRAYQDFLQWYLRGAADVYERLRSIWERSSVRESRAPWEEWGRWWDPASTAKNLAQLWQDQLHGGRRGSESESEPVGASEADEERPQHEELAELRRRLEELEDRLKG